MSRPAPAYVWAIEYAFRDARRTAGGEPTEDAQDALSWILARTDWTELKLEERMQRWGAPAPPLEIRREFNGTFDWSCRQLSENPDEVRRRGLPFWRQFTHNGTEGGVAAILASWAEAKARWMAANAAPQTEAGKLDGSAAPDSPQSGPGNIVPEPLHDEWAGSTTGAGQDNSAF